MANTVKSTLLFQISDTDSWLIDCDGTSQALNGKEVLQDLVRNHREEYNGLMDNERMHLVHAFEDYKATKAQAFRISTKARINDVTQTLSAVENEVLSCPSICADFGTHFQQFNNLKSRAGVETMLFITRGTTDLPLMGVAFTTEGVDNFLEGAMKTDTQHFLGKMEGFAVQGVQGQFVFHSNRGFLRLFLIGAAKNHQQRVAAMRAEIRNLINDGLRAFLWQPIYKS
jgi:hypothetical protein